MGLWSYDLPIEWLQEASLVITFDNISLYSEMFATILMDSNWANISVVVAVVVVVVSIG